MIYDNMEMVYDSMPNSNVTNVPFAANNISIPVNDLLLEAMEFSQMSDTYYLHHNIDQSEEIRTVKKFKSNNWSISNNKEMMILMV